MSAKNDGEDSPSPLVAVLKNRKNVGARQQRWRTHPCRHMHARHPCRVRLFSSRRFSCPYNPKLSWKTTKALPWNRCGNRIISVFSLFNRLYGDCQGNTLDRFAKKSGVIGERNHRLRKDGVSPLYFRRLKTATGVWGLPQKRGVSGNLPRQYKIIHYLIH